MNDKIANKSWYSLYFINFAATEASKFGQLNRSVQKKETAPSGVWICGSYGAKWTRQAPPGVRMRERERERLTSWEKEKKLFFFACFLT